MGSKTGKNKPFTVGKFNIGDYTHGYIRNYNKTEYKFEHYGVGPYDMEGNLVDKQILDMYEYFGITNVKKYLKTLFFQKKVLALLTVQRENF